MISRITLLPITVTVAVNHLKSKGSDCNAVGDPDTGDGSGNCNLTRKTAAEALVDWLDTDPTASGDSKYLIIGDLNSYDKEDPIDAIIAGPDDTPGTADDYTDTIYLFQTEAAYSYVFDGQTGYLDHALASPGLMTKVTGVAIWHINADEPDLIDYDMTFKRDAQDVIYAPDAYRSSDHDPIVVGISLGSPSLSLSKEVSPMADVDLGATVTYTLTLQNNGSQPASGVVLTDTLPTEIDFGSWVQQSGASIANDEITWNGDLPAGGTVTLVFTATLTNDVAYNGQTVTNTTSYQFGAESGSADASFTIRYVNYIYLPVILMEFLGSMTIDTADVI